MSNQKIIIYLAVISSKSKVFEYTIPNSYGYNAQDPPQKRIESFFELMESHNPKDLDTDEISRMKYFLSLVVTRDEDIVIRQRALEMLLSLVETGNFSKVNKERFQFDLTKM